MSNASAGQGTTLSWNSAAVAEITSITGPEFKVDTIDVTSHDSPSGLREFLAGLADPGEINIEGFFYPGDTNGQKALYDDMVARTLRTAVITFPAAMACTWTCTGIVTKFGTNSGKAGEAVTFSATIKLSGVPSLGITLSAGLTTPFMSFSAGTLAPTAAGNVYDYVLTEANGVTTITITPTAAAGVITITANGSSQTVVSGQASSAIALGAGGSITTVYIDVKETGKSNKRYTLKVVRAA